MSSSQFFPYFADGDVLVIAPNGQTWKLHANTLRNKSGEFIELLSSAPRQTAKRQKTSSSTVRWKVKMDIDPNDSRFCSFRILDPSVNEQATMPPNFNGLGVDPPYAKIYDNFFKILYDVDPSFDLENQGTLITDLISLLEAAESLEASAAVRLTIETNLLRTNQLLWTTVKNNPPAWCDIAIRLQSPVMFREAMAHIVGAWYMPSVIDKDLLQRLPNGTLITQIAVKKLRELVVKKREIEREMLDFIPASMQHAVNGNKNPTRATYANDIYLWQGLLLIRRFITTHMLDNKTWRRPDGGAKFYKAIGVGKASYLVSSDLVDFFRQFPMTDRGKEVFRFCLQVLKEEFRGFMRELLVNESQISENLPYLTCTRFEERELPWIG